MKAIPLGTGAALPEKKITNDMLRHYVETSDQWIRTRTGITQRFFAAPKELTSDLATQAGTQLLKRLNLKSSQIDLLIVATSTPDETFPATAIKVQYQLGAKGVAFDVNAACSGYVLALKLADQAIRLQHAKYAMVIGAETLSRILDMTDRQTCVLFGDGAGAVLLGASKTTNPKQGIIHCYVESDGAYHDILHTNGGVSTTQTAGVIQMRGSAVFRQAVDKLVASSRKIMKLTSTSFKDIDWLVPHQANQRIFDAVCAQLNVSTEKILSTIHLHGNTSAASIPLALDHGVVHGQIQPGHIILHQAVGAGLIWGGALLKWG